MIIICGLMQKAFAFEMAVSSVRFGVGVTREVGMDLKELGAKLAMVVADPIVARLPPVRTVVDSLERRLCALRPRPRRTERRIISRRDCVRPRAAVRRVRRRRR